MVSMDFRFPVLTAPFLLSRPKTVPNSSKNSKYEYAQSYRVHVTFMFFIFFKKSLIECRQHHMAKKRI